MNYIHFYWGGFYQIYADCYLTEGQRLKYHNFLERLELERKIKWNP